MTAKDLKSCTVFIFDLDGTVYEEVSHFKVYGEEIAKRLPADKRDAFFSETEQALSGQHALKYGVTYDPVQDRIFEDDEMKSRAGHAGDNQSPSGGLMHVDDPWGIYGAMGARFGLSGAELQASFLATRQHMQGEEFHMVGLPGLREQIDTLRSLGRKVVLMTNSPEPDSRAILDKLGLNGAFDALVFEAKKPIRVLEHFRRFHEEFNAPYEQMVSIGDHYRNEIQPAHSLGMKTVYIDRYLNRPRSGVTVQLQGPKFIAPLLESVIAEIQSV